jgi:hypothetical protein
MVPWQVYRLCQSNTTVTSEIARDNTQDPTKLFNKLFESNQFDQNAEDSVYKQKDALQMARECGKWGTSEPSTLFLQIYHDALNSLEKDPKAGVVSLPLMGSTGVVPLTIIAPLPDICRHISNCIVRAEKEVFLASNFWIHSDASTLITNALRKLSKIAGERGTRIVVKVIYDRGDIKQVYFHAVPTPSHCSK